MWEKQVKFLQVEVDLSRVAEELSGAFMELCDEYKKAGNGLVFVPLCGLTVCLLLG